MGRRKRLSIITATVAIALAAAVTATIASAHPNSSAKSNDSSLTIMGSLFEPDGSVWSKAAQTVEKVQESAFALPASPAGAEFQTAWQNAVNRVLAGQQSPAAALKQAQSQAQSAIDAAAS